MSKLDPKPTPNYPDKKSWDDLNSWVQSAFRSDRNSSVPKMHSLYYLDYKMDKKEIKDELEKIGLTVSESSPGFYKVSE